MDALQSRLGMPRADHKVIWLMHVRFLTCSLAEATVFAVVVPLHRQKTEHRDGSPDGSSVEVLSAQKKSRAGGRSRTASSTGEIPVRAPHASLSVLLSRRAVDHHLLATEDHWTSIVSTNGIS